MTGGFNWRNHDSFISKSSAKAHFIDAIRTLESRG